MHADIGIRGDRIEAIGDLSDATAQLELDARGLYVAPGFIDTHSHAGPGLATPGLSHGTPLLTQGITSVLVNPDGGGAEPDLAAQRAALLEDGLGVNVGQFISHGTVRAAVLGMQDRAPTPAELQRMEGLVRAAMEEGAFGLSSGPFYAPGSFSDTEELVALARVAAGYGGVYQSHIRDESNYTIGVVAAVEEVITVAREAGLPGVWTHAKALGPPVWGYAAALVRRVERASAAGIEVWADQYPYVASSTSLAAALLPRWAEAGGRDSLVARMDRPRDLARIREAMAENLVRRGGAERIQFRSVRQDSTLEGRRLSDVAAEWDVEALDAAVRLLRSGSPGIVSFNMDEADLRTIMRQPWTMTASDGGLSTWGRGMPHPRANGAFSRKIRRYVVEEAVLDLAAAVQSMTSLPAQVYRLERRGELRPGSAADVVVFNLERVRDVAEYTDPHHLSEGMVYVLVNGRLALADGVPTGDLVGRILRRR